MGLLESFFRALLFFSLSFNAPHALGGMSPDCQHYFIDAAGRWEPSGLEVGKDVGQSPYAKADHYQNGHGVPGVYRCHLILNERDINQHLYLYFGEIGDSAYLELNQSPEGTKRLILTHGLTSDPSLKPFYLRFWPLWLSLDQFYNGEGHYVLDLHYRDLAYPQTGLRSGVPEVLSFSALINRILVSQTRLYLLLEALLVLALALIIMIFWRQMSFRTRGGLGLLGLLSAVLLFNASSVPRFIFSPMVAIRLNDISNILGLPLLHMGFLPYLARPRSPALVLRLILAVSLFLCIASLNFDPNSGEYLIVYGLSLLASTLIIDGLTLALALKGLMPSSADHRATNHMLWISGLLFAIGLSDFINSAFMNNLSETFLAQYWYFLSCYLAQIYLAATHLRSEQHFGLALQDMRNEAQHSISKNWAQGDPLDVIALRVGELLGSKRVSLAKIEENELQIVGSLGFFKDPHKLLKIDLDSPVLRAVHNNVLWREQRPPRSPELKGLVQTDCVIMPLIKSGYSAGALSMTDFIHKGQLPSFFRNRLAVIRAECEHLYFTLLRERDLRSSNTLMNWTRLRVHPLQLDSEMYFMKHFRLSEVWSEFAFIVGDVVDSSVLSAQCGGENFQAALDATLNAVFQQFRDLGLIISRDKGDFISIMVPCQIGDLSSADAVQRAFKVLQYFNQENEELKFLQKSAGLSLSLNFRLVLSTFDYRGQKEAGAQVTSFSLLNDSEIDRACRALSHVAINAECLVLDRAFQKLPEAKLLMPLKPQRVKGQVKDLVLYRLSSERPFQMMTPIS